MRGPDGGSLRLSKSPRKTPKPANPERFIGFGSRTIRAPIDLRQEIAPTNNPARCEVSPRGGESDTATGTLTRAVAKKVRTPPPPRRVQAPQRRDTRRASRVGAGGRPPWIYAVGGAVVALIIAGAIVGALVAGGGGGSKTKAAVDYNTLPGVTKSKAPWKQEFKHLDERLLPLGLTTLAGHQGLAEHFHAHLDIFVNGKKVTVPALVGINIAGNYLTELHTHDARGVIHIEAQKARPFTLGQFFAEWGVYLGSRCIGAYCNGLHWYLNGQKQSGNPAGLTLKSHQEIAIVVGKPPAKIPSSYAFEPGE